MINWTEQELQRHIDDEIEESTTLDYKAAPALGKDKKDEITKDVSAMANADGGILIYGLKEHPTRRHVVEKLDPIDRTKFSKEWLDQVISNIRPYLQVTIYPVSLSTGPNYVAYVVDIPKGYTAHQATSLKYYRRHNFESVAMEDYEIRDVMNRAIAPNVSIRFESRASKTIGEVRYYRLHPIVKNEGYQIVNHIKLLFISPSRFINSAEILGANPNATSVKTPDNTYIVSLQTARPLFPEDERDVGLEMQWEFSVLKENLRFLALRQVFETDTTVRWKLFADNMTPKNGTFSYYDFQY
jgi:hypothetical protein